MGTRYCFEIVDGPAMYYWFAYFDTHDHLADFLFEYEHVNITVEGEFGDEEEPYKIILCRIAREDRESFLHAVELLPSLMEYVGKTDYDEYCRGFMMDAYRYVSKRREGGRIMCIRKKQ